ncbi:MAG: precorrin-6A reductase [Arenibacterium sp.]
MASSEGSTKHVLLLAGSSEARTLATALATWSHVRVTLSQLYKPRKEETFSGITRLGAFGGNEGFESFMKEAKVDAVLDAAHPFAVRVGARASRYCAKHGLPYARVLRPPWRPQPEDQWREVRDEHAASALLKPGQRIFTTTGLTSLPTLTSDDRVTFFVRRLREDPVPDMPRHVTFVHGEGPFSVEHEVAMFRDLKIDELIVKNSGGMASATKLEAARKLGLPVMLIARPAQPEGRIFDNVQDALNWVAAL